MNKIEEESQNKGDKFIKKMNIVEGYLTMREYDKAKKLLFDLLDLYRNNANPLFQVQILIKIA
jgi:flagellin-specific chaperone FliS